MWWHTHKPSTQGAKVGRSLWPAWVHSDVEMGRELTSIMPTCLSLLKDGKIINVNIKVLSNKNPPPKTCPSSLRSRIKYFWCLQQLTKPKEKQSGVHWVNNLREKGQEKSTTDRMIWEGCLQPVSHQQGELRRACKHQWSKCFPNTRIPRVL